MSWYIETRDQNTQILYFSTWILNQYSNSLWLSLCINENLKKTLSFFYSSIMSRSQNALHVTDDSCVKGVLQLTGTIVMASSDKKKIYDSKSLTTITIKSFSDNFTVKLMMRPESLYQKTISVCSEHFKWVNFFSSVEEESGVFDTLVHTHLTLKLTFFWHFNNRHWSFLQIIVHTDVL